MAWGVCTSDPNAAPQALPVPSYCCTVPRATPVGPSPSAKIRLQDMGIIWYLMRDINARIWEVLNHISLFQVVLKEESKNMQKILRTLSI